MPNTYSPTIRGKPSLSVNIDTIHKVSTRYAEYVFAHYSRETTAFLWYRYDSYSVYPICRIHIRPLFAGNQAFLLIYIRLIKCLPDLPNTYSPIIREKPRLSCSTDMIHTVSTRYAEYEFAHHSRETTAFLWYKYDSYSVYLICRIRIRPLFAGNHAFLLI
jgi:hypothetical protein